MFESVKRANENSAFNDGEKKCAYDLQNIETYHQKLARAYIECC